MVSVAALALVVLVAQPPSGPVAVGPRSLAPTSVAAGAPSPAVPPYSLKLDPVRDGIVAGSATALWITSELLQPTLAPRNCRWCDRAPDGTDTLNALDRWGRNLRWSSPATADVLSSVLAFGVVPLGTAGLDWGLARGDGVASKTPEDLLIIAEATSLSMLFNQVVKLIAGRERPFVHVLPPDQKPLTSNPSENNLSFYSGHAAFAFSLVVSAGTVAELRGYSHRALIWAIGLPVAAAVGLLRMGADKHYLTDVLAGAVLGSAFGVAIPLLMHGRTGSVLPMQATVGVGPGVMVLAGRF